MRVFLLAVSCLTTAACVGAEPRDGTEARGAPSGPGLPLLPAGQHYGIAPSLDLLPISIAAALDARLEEARGHGMQIARLRVSWRELEPTDGSFELEDFFDRLDRLTSDDARVHLLIETIDSGGFAVPRDLAYPGSPTRLADDRAMDDPVILERFGALVDRIVPRLQDRVFAISVGNEPDNRFDELPALSFAGKAWTASVAGFTAAARARIQAVAPQIAVAMTVNQRSLEADRDITKMIEPGDVLVMNYYCQDVFLQVQGPEGVAAELDRIVTVAAGRPIVFQEVGCPAGRSPSAIGASEERQAAFFAEVTRQIETRPVVRAAFAYQAVDWEPSLVRQIEDAFAAEGHPEVAQLYGETVGTIGLLSFVDAAPRAAWQQWLDAIDRTAR